MRDVHFHIMDPHSLMPANGYQLPALGNAEAIAACMEAYGLAQVCIPSISLYDPIDFVCNPLALYAKTLAPERVFALAGLRYAWPTDTPAGLLRQAEALLALGFDGLKMICKPNARRGLPVAIDAPLFEPLFAAAEAKQWPILFHVGDPATFWSRAEAPAWAEENGWFYGDDPALPTLEQLYGEVERVLERHPALRVTFAHFFFLSEQIPRLQALLNRYPNLRVDVTPGTEMYVHFSARREEARAFFEANAGRVLLGTDNTAGHGEEGAALLRAGRANIERLRRFYETDQREQTDDGLYHGLRLSEPALHALYDGGFTAFLGSERPKAVDRVAAARLCRELLPTADALDAPTREHMTRLYRELIGAFEQTGA